MTTDTNVTVTAIQRGAACRAAKGDSTHTTNNVISRWEGLCRPAHKVSAEEEAPAIMMVQDVARGVTLIEAIIHENS